MSTSATSILSLGIGDPTAPDYGGRMDKVEKRRKNLINQGLERINAVYGGGAYPIYTQAMKGSKFNPTTPYYLNRNQSFAPYARRGGKELGPDYGPLMIPGLTRGSEQANWSFMNIGAGGLPVAKWLGLGEDQPPTNQEMLNKGRLYTKGISPTYKGFTPEFFQQRQQDYIDYAMPQLAEQYRNTSAQLRYGLSNRGLTGGSVANKSVSDLERSTGTAQQTIVDTARQQATSLRDRIEAARQGDINMLYQTADPSRATSQAVSNASSFQSPSSFVPIANMFANLANQYYLGQVLNTYRQPTGGGSANYNAGPVYDNNYNFGALPSVGGGL